MVVNRSQSLIGHPIFIQDEYSNSIIANNPTTRSQRLIGPQIFKQTEQNDSIKWLVTQITSKDRRESLPWVWEYWRLCNRRPQHMILRSIQCCWWHPLPHARWQVVCIWDGFAESGKRCCMECCSSSSNRVWNEGGCKTRASQHLLHPFLLSFKPHFLIP